jgi:hypothetical protein
MIGQLSVGRRCVRGEDDEADDRREHDVPGQDFGQGEDASSRRCGRIRQDWSAPAAAAAA